MGSKQSSSPPPPPPPTAKRPPPTPPTPTPLLPSPPQKSSSSSTNNNITSSLSEISKPLLEKSLFSDQVKGSSVNLDQFTKSRMQETCSSPNQELNVADGSSCSSLRYHSSMGLKISSSPAPPPLPPPPPTAKPLPPPAILPKPTLPQPPLLPSPPQKPSSTTTNNNITSSLSEIRKPLLEKSLSSDQVKGLSANLYQLTKSGKQDCSSPNQEPNSADGSSGSSFHDHSSMGLKLSSSPASPNAAADPSGRRCTNVLSDDTDELILKVDEVDKKIKLLKQKVENNSNDKKKEVAFAIMLLAYTIFGGYNVAVYTSGNCNMMPYQFTAMVISLIGVITFGWTALMTVGFKAESASEGLSQPIRIMRWFYFQSLNAVPIIAALVAVSLYISFLYCAYSTSCAKEQQNISGDHFCAFVKHYIQ